DAEHAKWMLRAMRKRDHEVLTGVCLLVPIGQMRFMYSDSAKVMIGNLPDHEIEAYITSGLWRGKAGAYNLEDRLNAGWPISYVGDPATIMGLPMQKLPTWIAQTLKENPLRNAGPTGL
ncbi:MAG TPA: Maf family protein, partial [Phycisphaerales bacterium]|nr:Maf family protein [Phycisphaerales bacterium]